MQDAVHDYLRLLDRQRQKILAALELESYPEDIAEMLPEAAAQEWRVPVLWQLMTRESERAHAKAKAATVPLATHLWIHWLAALDRLQDLHLRVLEDVVRAHEDQRQANYDLMNDHNEALGRARQEWKAVVAARQETANSEAAESGSQTPPATKAATTYLLSWREILNAVNLPSNNENRRRLRQLNESHDGPILFIGQGAQPKVAKNKLVDWWNGLEQRWAELDQREADAHGTTEDRYAHGKEEVVPGVSGHVKRRRRKKPGAQR
jgi:hypothetical protein